MKNRMGRLVSALTCAATMWICAPAFGQLRVNPVTTSVFTIGTNGQVLAVLPGGAIGFTSQPLIQSNYFQGQITVLTGNAAAVSNALWALLQARPQFSAFNTDQFGTNGGGVAIKSGAGLTNITFTQTGGGANTFPAGQKFDSTTVSNLMTVTSGGSNAFNIVQSGTVTTFVDPVLSLTMATYDASTRVWRWGVTNYFGSLYGLLSPTNATPGRAAAIGPDGGLTNGVPTLGELNFLTGLRSNLQAQLDYISTNSTGGGGISQGTLDATNTLLLFRINMFGTNGSNNVTFQLASQGTNWTNNVTFQLASQGTNWTNNALGLALGNTNYTAAVSNSLYSFMTNLVFVTTNGLNARLLALGTALTNYTAQKLDATNGNAYGRVRILNTGATDYTDFMQAGTLLLVSNATQGVIWSYDSATDFATNNKNTYYPLVTANRAAQFGAGGVLQSSGVSNAELAYVGGVTGALQTQINGNKAGLLQTSNGLINLSNAVMLIQGGTGNNTILTNPTFVGTLTNLTTNGAGKWLFYDTNGTAYVGIGAPPLVYSNTLFCLSSNGNGGFATAIFVSVAVNGVTNQWVPLSIGSGLAVDMAGRALSAPGLVALSNDVQELKLLQQSFTFGTGTLATTNNVTNVVVKGGYLVGANMTFTTNADGSITIASTGGGGSGETNVLNVAGTTNNTTRFGLVSTKVGVTNLVKTVSAGSNVSITDEAGTNLVLNVPGGTTGTATNSGYGTNQHLDKVFLTNATSVGPFTQTGTGSNWMDGLFLGTNGPVNLFFGGNTSSNGVILMAGNDYPRFDFLSGNSNVSAAVTYALSVSNKTANYQLLSTESGRLFSNKGAAGVITNDLPNNPTNGLFYTFVIQTNLAVWVHGTNATIRYGNSSTTNSGFLNSTNKGYATLTAISSNEWMVTSISTTNGAAASAAATWGFQ